MTAFGDQLIALGTTKIQKHPFCTISLDIMKEHLLLSATFPFEITQNFLLSEVTNFSALD